MAIDIAQNINIPCSKKSIGVWEGGKAKIGFKDCLEQSKKSLCCNLTGIKSGFLTFLDPGHQVFGHLPNIFL